MCIRDSCTAVYITLVYLVPGDIHAGFPYATAVPLGIRGKGDRTRATDVPGMAQLAKLSIFCRTYTVCTVFVVFLQGCLLSGCSMEV